MAETKQHITKKLDNGNVLISDDVIATIVANAIKDVDGVAGLGAKPGMDVITKKGWGKAIKITISQNDELTIDCNILVTYGRAVVAVATAAQDAITAAVESLTGITVTATNVNVSGIAKA